MKTAVWLLLCGLAGCVEQPVACPKTYDFYPDLDLDGFGDAAGETLVACEATPGWVTSVGDCDDRDPDVNPAATEICNGHDDDCDVEIDEELVLTWYMDRDGDGYGDRFSPVDTCYTSDSLVDTDTDCDDLDPNAYPGAPELPDRRDNDCDGQVDD